MGQMERHGDERAQGSHLLFGRIRRDVGYASWTPTDCPGIMGVVT